jgi:hypothetical protein
MGSKNEPGNYDCYANADPDEPMFILLGRDRHAAVLTRLWAILRAHDGEDEDKLAEALTCAANMDKWADSLGKRRLNGAHPVIGIDPGAAAECNDVIEKLYYTATEGLPEHPADFDHSCQCGLCLSYD